MYSMRPPAGLQTDRRAIFNTSSARRARRARPMDGPIPRVVGGTAAALAYLVYSGTHVHNRLVFLNDASQVENAMSEMRHC